MALIMSRNNSPIVRDKEAVPAYDVRNAYIGARFSLTIIIMPRWRRWLLCYMLQINSSITQKISH